MNGVYNAFTSVGVNSSNALRDINDKELKQVDSKGVKAWLASFETLEGETGTKNNADRLYVPKAAQLAAITDALIKILNVNFPQPPPSR